MAINLPIISKFDAKGIEQAETSLGKLGKMATSIAAVATTAVVGIATKSIKAFGDFDAKLNQSVAIMGDVSEAMRNDMAAAARQVAKDTTFSADQAAESFFFLASAGLDATQSIKAMPQVAKFAQAGMFEMSRATDLLTDAQSALGMVIKDDANANLKEMTRLSDVLVRANTLANASVEQFSTALTTKAGASLRQFGKDAEEGVAVLAALADQGIKGELAGTNLSIAIRDLTSKALANKKAFADAGVAVFDSAGNMRNMADIVADLEKATDGMSDAQKKATFTQLGFSDKSMGTLAALIGTSDAIRNYEKELRSASGFTDDVASKQLETFNAQVELLKSRVMDVGIGIGAVLVPALLTATDSLGPLIDSAGVELVKAFEALVPVIELAIKALPMLLPLLTNLLVLFVKIATPLMEVAARLLPLFADILGQVISLVNEIIDPLAVFLTELIQPLIPAVQEMVKAFYPLMAAILPVFLDLLRSLLPVIHTLLIDVIIPLAPAFISLIQSILPLLTMILPPLIDLLKTLLIPALQFAGAVMVALVDTGINFLKSGLTTLMDFMTPFAKTFTDIWNNISKTVKGVINGILGFIQGMVNGVIDGVNAVIRAINSIKVDIPSWIPFFGGQSFGFNLPQLGRVNIPRLADGGIVMPKPGGVLANLAEAGKPEVVIPLDRLGSMGGEKTVNYNITVNAGMGADGQDLGRVIVDQILRYERSSGRVFARA